jgi:hypothetical protein
LASDIIASSRVTLNTNFANLNTDKVDINSTYADPAWITSLAGSKITGNIGGNAATATALATARTIAGVSFDGTANIAIPSTGLSDSSDIVRGGASVASGQVLYGTGAGVAGSEAAFTYSAVNDQLHVGTIGPLDTNDKLSASVAGSGRVNISAYNANLGIRLHAPSTGTVVYLDAIGTAIPVHIRPTSAGFPVTGLIVQPTGNVGLGTTTDDGTNRLQVAGSVAVTGGSIGVKNGFGLIGTDNALGFVATAGQFELRGTTGARLGTITSAGVFGVYNELPTTGVTQLIVRAGAGQSTTNLQTWQNAAGTQVAAVLSTGTISASGFTTASAIFNPSADMSVDAGTGFNVLLRPNNGVERVRVSSTFIRTTNSQLYQFSSDSTSFGTPDTGWSRNAAGVIEVNNGTAGTFRDLYLRGVRPVGSTVANLPTASGNTGMMATVTDATVTTIGTTVAGGGANTVLVWSNGTNWRIYAN